MRRTLALGLAALALSAASSPAVADNPEPTFDRPPPIPLPDDARRGPDGIWRFTLPPHETTDVPAAESPCGFPLRIETGPATVFIVKTFPSGRQRVFSPRPSQATQTFTNTANGKSVTVNVGGPATLTPLSGGRVREQSYGATVWPVFPDELPIVGGETRIIYFPRGSQTAVFGPAPEDGPPPLLSYEIHAPEVRDLCEDID